LVPGGEWTLPEWEGLPETFTIPGFELCLNYVGVEGEFFGVDLAYMLAAIAFIAALAIVGGELRS
jgi:hypothetical protein